MPPSLNFVLMLAALLALAAAFAVRRHPWSAALWVPLVVISLAQITYALRIMAVGRGQGVGALGGMIALLVGLPWFAILLASLFAYPRKQSPLPLMAGAILALLFYFAIPFFAAEVRVLQVVAPDGKPAATFGCFGWPIQDGIEEAHQFYQADSAGRIKFRFAPQGFMNFQADKYQGRERVTLDLAGEAFNRNEQVPAGVTRVHAGWAHGNAAYWVAPHTPIPLFLKNSNEIISLPLQAFIRERLARASEGKLNSEELGGLCGNPESFDLIPEISALIQTQPKLRRNAIQELVNMARVLREIYDSEHQSSSRNDEWHSAVDRWAGASPRLIPSARASMVDTKLQECAAQLIAASKPYWGDDDSSANVVDELGALARPAFRDFPAALATAQPRARGIMLMALERSHLPMAEMEWAASSDDPEIVVAAYQGLQDHLTSAERAQAIERLEKINQPGVNSNTQMSVARLLSNFREATASPSP